MATRSTIALEYADGTIKQVYCHWDGYLENNGRCLQEYYSDPVKLGKLIDLGDLSSLGSVIGTKHDFDDNYGGVCTFYGRDRDEDSVDARCFENYEDYLTNMQEEEYNYILRQVNGKSVWYVRHWDSGNKFETLTKAFERVAVESLK